MSGVQFSVLELLVVSLGILGSSLLGESWVLSDLSVDLLVEFLNAWDSSGLEGLVPSLELELESFASLEGLNVLINVGSEDSVSQNLVFFTFDFTGESLGGVGNIKSSVSGTLKDGEDLGSGGGGLKTSVQDDLEGSSVLNILADIVVLAGVGVTSIHGVKTNLLEKSSGDKETGGIGRGVVGQTGVQSPLLEFKRVSGSENSVTLDGGVDNLGDHSVVGDSGHKSVLGGVVFILVLDNQSLSGEVVSFSLNSSSELGLISHEVRLVLD